MLRITDAIGLGYRLTAGTILAGRWEQLMEAAQKWHTGMRKKTVERLGYKVTLESCAAAAA